jgi:iron complex outermembrane receptor protein
LREAVKVKRDDPAIVDAIVAKDVNKLPDKNLAEAASRVPGVVINREFGEGERVSLRGLGPNLVHTTVNGHNVAVADWFVLEQLAATRSFNYLVLPSETIGLLKVYKSPTAELDEGGIGGTIDVRTRKPLDLKSSAVSASLQNAYTQKSGKNDPNGSLMANWKNSAGDFGILFAGVYDRRNIRRDGVEVLGYSPQPAAGGNLVPDLIGSALFQQERVRKAFNAEMQFRPMKNLGWRRHLDQRHHGGKYRRRRHRHFFRQWHDGPRRRLRRHRPHRVCQELVRRSRWHLYSERQMARAFRRRPHQGGGRHHVTAFRRVWSAGCVHI